MSLSPAQQAELDQLQAHRQKVKAARLGRPAPAAPSNANESLYTRPKPTLLGAMVADVAAQERPPIRSYSTGLPELDKLLGGGVSTRQLTSVLGPPGAGKTAWAIALALHVQSAAAVLYISTELEADELTARLAANVVGVPWRDIVRGKVERAKVQEALAGLRIRAVGCDQIPRDGSAVEAIATTARGMTSDYGAPPMLIVRLPSGSRSRG